MIKTFKPTSFGGMLLSAVATFGGTALAADLPTAPPAYVASPPAFTWTGFYMGGQVGYERGISSTHGMNDATGAIVGQPDYNPDGFVGGIHHGYNYQISQLVIGYEGSLDGSTYRGSGLNNTGTILHSTNIPFENSIRGRLGLAWDRTLFFATGGAAFGRVQNTSTNSFNGFSDSFDDIRTGWTVGGGVEYAITNNWLVRTEYRHMDYGNINEFEAFSTGGLYSVTKHERDDKVQIGLSYKFDKRLFQMVSSLMSGN
ncbi:MAG: porin family protein [Alphaproteobacteria bacterium]|nr:porin family protein [Alphaproteobacteria bacterium]